MSSTLSAPVTHSKVEVELFASNLRTPTHMEWTQDGRLLVSETTAGRVTDISRGGDFIDASPFAWGLETPASICPMPDGSIYTVEIWGGSRQGHRRRR